MSVFKSDAEKLNMCATASVCSRDRLRAVALFLSLGAGTNLAIASDWLQFAYDSDQSANNTSETIVTSANVHSLVPIYTRDLGGTTSAPVYLSSVATSKGIMDLLFMTARNGTLLAVNANTGVTVWSQPTVQTSYAIDSAPVIDPNRQFVYGYGADGKVHKYAVADGTEVFSGGWPAVSSLKPGEEHGSGALEIARSTSGSTFLYAVTTGFYGDGGDYQGHVTSIDLATGAWKVFNANCSNNPIHFITNGMPGINDCATPRSGIWGRSGAVYDRRTDRMYVATGNGNFNVVLGGYNWGDSLLALKPDGSGSQSGIPLDSYTPSNYSNLEVSDSDFGSGSVVLLPTPATSAVAHLGAIMGKDAQLRLLNLDNLSGQGSAGGVGGEIQKLDMLGINTDIPTPHPAVWVNARGDKSTWVFVGTPSNFSGVQLVINGSGQPSLAVRWTISGFSGTSPIVANDVLYYGGCSGGICAIVPTTGQILWSAPLFTGCCMGSWMNPIMVNGRLFVSGGSFTVYALDEIFGNGFE